MSDYTQKLFERREAWVFPCQNLDEARDSVSAWMKVMPFNIGRMYAATGSEDLFSAHFFDREGKEVGYFSEPDRELVFYRNGSIKRSDAFKDYLVF